MNEKRLLMGTGETWITLAEARNRSYGRVEWWTCRGINGEMVDLKQQRPGAPNDRIVLLYSCGDMYLGGWEKDEYKGFGVFYFNDGYVIAGHCEGSNIKSLKCMWLPAAPYWRRNKRPNSVVQIPRKSKDSENKKIEKGLPFLYIGSPGGDWHSDPRATVILKSGTTRVGPWKRFSPLGNWWKDHEKSTTSRSEIRRLLSFAKQPAATSGDMSLSNHSSLEGSLGDIVFSTPERKQSKSGSGKHLSQSTLTTMHTSASSYQEEFDQPWSIGGVGVSPTSVAGAEWKEPPSLQPSYPVSPTSANVTNEPKSPKSVKFVEGTKPATTPLASEAESPHSQGQKTVRRRTVQPLQETEAHDTASPHRTGPPSDGKPLSEYFEEVSKTEKDNSVPDEYNVSEGTEQSETEEDPHTVDPLSFGSAMDHDHAEMAGSPKWVFDEQLRQSQISSLTSWLTSDVIGYEADTVEMRCYAHKLVDCGFHNPEMIQDLCSPDDVVLFDFMKPVHKRLFLSRANLKMPIHIPIRPS